MRTPNVMRKVFTALASLTLACALIGMERASAGQAPTFALAAGPWEFNTYQPAMRIRVSVVARGLAHPWGLAFLPNGDMLVSERRGSLRIIRDGKLDPTPIEGMLPVAQGGSGGLMDIALHPQFSQNGWVYFVYTKSGPLPARAKYYATTALGRGRFDGSNRLRDVEDVLVPNAWGASSGGQGARIIFAPDGTLFMSQPFRRESERAQNTSDHIGTILRINADGSVPKDNPFVGKAGYLPEIYSYGHRAVEGMAFHPDTGALWVSEHGPQGGDELNIIVPGGNYGWPLASYGIDYDGQPAAPRRAHVNMIEPKLLWVPSIAPSGTMFYTGERFAKWRGNLFVGALMEGRMPGSGHVQRIAFNEHGEQLRERLLSELKQRIRDVKQGPDGLFYILTDEVDGALLRVEPVG
jgi:aldose sugar dehydrogenase